MDPGPVLVPVSRRKLAAQKREADFFFTRTEAVLARSCHGLRVLVRVCVLVCMCCSARGPVPVPVPADFVMFGLFPVTEAWPLCPAEETGGRGGSAHA